MAYAIMRCKKLRGYASVAGSLSHCFRERETHNADPALRHLNRDYFASSVTEAMGALRAGLPDKVRKNAVLAVEYFMGASPEWWQQATPAQQDEFFKRSISWLENKFGAENVLVASVHRDETSPHLSAFVIPMHEGKLSAKQAIGTRGKMSADQSSYARSLADLGLKRGIEGSKAEHKTIQQFYTELKVQPKPKPLKIAAEDVTPAEIPTGKFWPKTQPEPPEAVANRVNLKIEQSHIAKMAAQTACAVTEAKKARADRERAGEQLNALTERFRAFIELDRIDPKALDKLADRANEYMAQVRAQREAEKAQKLAAEKAAKAAQKARERFETQVAELVAKRGRVGGMKATIAQYAHDAMKAAAGDCWRVDWAAVMLAAAQESFYEHDQEQDEIISDLEALAPISAEDLAKLKRAVMRFPPAGRGAVPCLDL